eukprot:TRINITY_DN4168_c0_g1_i3.p3 TRINITY_DN4168_c0_g1~~TRINITY_DN4168_c0_g1_i3.p3  ORF type:complete len:140 (+),score=13.17 TRINITY_DN4168_c0_g1_i3:512-931(+)
MDGVRIPGVRAVWEHGLGDPCDSCPASAVEGGASLVVDHRVVNWEALPNNVSGALELQHQVVTVRSHLDLSVPLGPADEEHLHHLMVPQLVGRTDWGAGRRVVVEGCVHSDDDLLPESLDGDGHPLVPISGIAVPRVRD